LAVASAKSWAAGSNTTAVISVAEMVSSGFLGMVVLEARICVDAWRFNDLDALIFV
jgi:hypothetical protein